MRAAVLPDYSAPLEIREVPTPDPGPGEILLRVTACGVCHSDLHLRAHVPGTPEFPRLPWILGHEITGVVDQLGPGANGFQEGDAVAVWGGWGCGRCRVCRAGLEQNCPVGSRLTGVFEPGGFAEYLLVPESRHLVALGDADPVTSAPLTDAGLTAFSAVAKARARLEGGGEVVVLGAGGLGQFAIQYLAQLTDATIIAVDLAAGKRARARELGAKHALDAADATLPEQVRELTDGFGAAAVIDFVGTPGTASLTARLVAPRGRIVLVGLAGGAITIGHPHSPPEAEAVTSFLGSRDQLVEVMALAQSKGIHAAVEPYALDDADRALSDLAAGRIASRGVIVP